jgi:hypothetical protein
MFEHKSSCSGGCTAPWWWRFSRPWRGCFRACSRRATGGDALLWIAGLLDLLLDCLQSRSKDVSLWAAVHSHVLIIPDEARHWLVWCVQLSRHDLLFPERISANPLWHCFDSGLSPQTFQASWLSPLLNPPEFLITFNCPIDEQSQNFQWF